MKPLWHRALDWEDLGGPPSPHGRGAPRLSWASLLIAVVIAVAFGIWFIMAADLLR